MLLRNYLTHKAIQITHKLTDAMATTFKADDADTDTDEERLRAKVKAMLADLEVSWADLPEQFTAILEPFAKGAAADGLAQIEVAMQTATDLANERATEWAGARAAEMVGMKYVDGALVPNPNAEWVISESTRDMLQNVVTEAVDKGWSVERLAKEIGNDPAFGDDRAMLIARTETAIADMQGNMIAYRAAEDMGIDLQKEWLTAGDDDVSDDCAANEAQGPIDLADVFQSGADCAPEHPNCRCDCLPVRFNLDTTPEGSPNE